MPDTQPSQNMIEAGAKALALLAAVDFRQPLDPEPEAAFMDASRAVLTAALIIQAVENEQCRTQSSSENGTMTEPEFRHAWRGISAPCSLSKDRPDAGMTEGWIAVALDDQGKEAAFSVWTDEAGYGQRHIAMWLSSESARNLAAALTEMAESLEGSADV